jgi:hypothetical protein
MPLLRVAEWVRGAADALRKMVPLVRAVTNPGMRTRHWTKMSDTVGFPISFQVWLPNCVSHRRPLLCPSLSLCVSLLVCLPHRLSHCISHSYVTFQVETMQVMLDKGSIDKCDPAQPPREGFPIRNHHC